MYYSSNFMKITACQIAYIFICALLFSSCGSYKKIPYFQDINYSKDNPQQIANFNPLTIQPADILNISVNSLNPIAYNDSIGRIVGYSVDQNGNIKIPLVGSVNVAGQTTAMVETEIQKRLQPFLKNAEVVVHMKNFKISVIGDVAKPNVYPVVSERITIIEALAMAGDLNITAKRKNILLVREMDGKRQLIPVDISSSSIFTSPYFYLRNNDMIYVEPDKTKYASVDGSYRTFSLVLSGLSIVAIILTNVL